MENKIGILFISIFAIIVMFLVPTYQITKKQDDLAQQIVDTETTNFVDAVRSKGYVDQKMIDEFLNAINIGSYAYRLEMVHEKKFYHPIYENVADPSSFTGEYEVLYEEFHTKQINEYLESTKGVKYKMSIDDFFSVKVENIGDTSANIILSWLQGFSQGSSPAILTKYGGKILNENY